MLLDFSVSVCSESQPEVIHCLRLVLMDAVRDTVRQVISVLRCGRNRETDLNKPHVPDHLLQSLPQEWGYIPRESRRKEPSKGEHISSLRKCPLKKQALRLFSCMYKKKTGYEGLALSIFRHSLEVLKCILLR